MIDKCPLFLNSLLVYLTGVFLCIRRFVLEPSVVALYLS
jgi:hypothetical protein